MELAVDVRGLTKVYEGKVRALDGIDLAVGAGNVFTLLGPNGARVLPKLLTGRENRFGVLLTHGFEDFIESC